MLATALGMGSVASGLTPPAPGVALDEPEADAVAVGMAVITGAVVVAPAGALNVGGGVSVGMGGGGSSFLQAPTRAGKTNRQRAAAAQRFSRMPVTLPSFWE